MHSWARKVKFATGGERPFAYIPAQDEAFGIWARNCLTVLKSVLTTHEKTLLVHMSYVIMLRQEGVGKALQPAGTWEDAWWYIFGISSAYLCSGPRLCSSASILEVVKEYKTTKTSGKY